MPSRNIENNTTNKTDNNTEEDRELENITEEDRELENITEEDREFDSIDDSSDDDEMDSSDEEMDSSNEDELNGSKEEDTETQTGGADCGGFKNIDEAIAPFAKIHRQMTMKIILDWAEYRKIGKIERFKQKFFKRGSFGNSNKIFEKFLAFLECVYANKITGTAIELTVDQLNKYQKKKIKQRLLIAMTYIYCIAIGKDSTKIDDFISKIINTYQEVEKFRKEIKSKKKETKKEGTIKTEIIKDIDRAKEGRAKILNELYRSIYIDLIKLPPGQLPPKPEDMDTYDDITVYIYNALLDRASIKEKQIALSKEAAARRQDEIDKAKERTAAAEAKLKNGTKLVQQYSESDTIISTYMAEQKNINDSISGALNEVVEAVKGNLPSTITVKEEEIKKYLKNESDIDEVTKPAIIEAIKKLGGDRIEFINTFNNFINRLNNLINNININSQLPLFKDNPTSSSTINTILAGTNKDRQECINILKNLQNPDLTPIPKDLSEFSEIKKITKEQALLFTNANINSMGVNISDLTPDAFAAIPPELFKDFNENIIDAFSDKQIEKMTTEQANKLIDFLSITSNATTQKAKSIMRKIVSSRTALAGGGKKRKLLVGGAAVAAAAAAAPAPERKYNALVQAYVDIILPKIQNKTEKDDELVKLLKEVTEPQKQKTGLLKKPISIPSNFHGSALEDAIKKQYAHTEIGTAINIFKDITLQDLSDALKTTDGAKIGKSLITQLEKKEAQINDITADNFAIIRDEVFATFTISIINNLNQEHIEKITPGQIKALANSADGFKKLNAFGNNFQYIKIADPMTFQEIPGTILNNMDTSIISDAQLGTIIPNQFNVLNNPFLKALCNADKIQYIKSEVFAGIIETKLKELLENSKNCVTTDQLKALKTAKEFQQTDLYKFDLNELTKEQIGHINEAQMKKLCDLATPVTGDNSAIGVALVAIADDAGILALLGGAPAALPGTVKDLYAEIQRVKQLASTVQIDAYKICLVAKIIDKIGDKLSSLTSDAISGISPFVFSQLSKSITKLDTTALTRVTNEQAEYFAKYSRVSELEFAGENYKNVSAIFTKEYPAIVGKDYIDPIDIGGFINRICNSGNFAGEKIIFVSKIIKDIVNNIEDAKKFKPKLLTKLGENNKLREFTKSSKELGIQIGKLIVSVSTYVAIPGGMLPGGMADKSIIINNFLIAACKTISPAVAETQLQDAQLSFFEGVFEQLAKEPIVPDADKNGGISPDIANQIIKKFQEELYTNIAGNAVAALGADANVVAIKNFAISSQNLGSSFGTLMLRAKNVTTDPPSIQTKLLRYVRFINGICSDVLTGGGANAIARNYFIQGLLTSFTTDVVNVTPEQAKFFIEKLVDEAALANFGGGAGVGAFENINHLLASDNKEIYESIQKLITKSISAVIAPLLPATLQAAIVKIVELVCPAALSGAGNDKKLAFVTGIFTSLTADGAAAAVDDVFADAIINAIGTGATFPVANLGFFADSDQALGELVGKLVVKSGNAVPANVAHSVALISAVCAAALRGGAAGILLFVKGIFTSITDDVAVDAAFADAIINAMSNNATFANLGFFADSDQALGELVGKLIVKSGNGNVEHSVALINAVVSAAGAALSAALNKLAFVTGIFTSLNGNEIADAAAKKTFAGTFIKYLSNNDAGVGGIGETFIQANLEFFVDSSNALGVEVGKLMVNADIAAAAVAVGDVGEHARWSAKLIGAMCSAHDFAGGAVERINFMKGVFQALANKNQALDNVCAGRNAPTDEATFAQHIITSLASVGGGGAATQLINGAGNPGDIGYANNHFNILEGNFRNLTQIEAGANNQIGKLVGHLLIAAGAANIWNSVHFLRIVGQKQAAANNGTEFVKAVFETITNANNFGGVGDNYPTKCIAMAAFANAILVIIGGLAAPVADATHLKLQSNPPPAAAPTDNETTLCHNDFLWLTDAGASLSAEVLAKLIFCAGANDAQRAWIKYAAVAAVARSHNGSAQAAGGGGAIPPGPPILPAHISQSAALITARTASGAANAAANPNGAGALAAGARAAAVTSVFISTYAMSACSAVPGNNNPNHAAADLNAFLVRQAAGGAGGAQASAAPTAPTGLAAAANVAKRRALLLSMPLPTAAETAAAVANVAPAFVAAVAAHPDFGVNATIVLADAAATAKDIAIKAKEAKEAVDAAAAAAGNPAAQASAANFRLFATGSALMINIARANNIINAAQYAVANPGTSARGGFAAQALAAIPGGAQARGAAAAADDVIFLVNALAYYINGAAVPDAANNPTGLHALFNALFGGVAATITNSPAVPAAFVFPNWANIFAFTNAIALVGGGGGVGEVLADQIINNIVDFPGDATDNAGHPADPFFLLGGRKISYRVRKLKKSKTNYPKSKKYHSRGQKQYHKQDNKQFTSHKKYSVKNKHHKHQQNKNQQTKRH